MVIFEPFAALLGGAAIFTVLSDETTGLACDSHHGGDKRNGIAVWRPYLLPEAECRLHSR